MKMFGVHYRTLPFDPGKVYRGEMAKCKSCANGQPGQVPGVLRKLVFHSKMYKTSLPELPKKIAVRLSLEFANDQTNLLAKL